MTTMSDFHGARRGQLYAHPCPERSEKSFRELARVLCVQAASGSASLHDQSASWLLIMPHETVHM